MAYSKGSIVRIKLNDFMTYAFVELRPGPSLNVVVGTNGSGKSSLVCAICLGLAGTPQTVGRASHVGDYIRHGAESALIEIELWQLALPRRVYFLSFCAISMKLAGFIKHANLGGYTMFNPKRSILHQATASFVEKMVQVVVLREKLSSGNKDKIPELFSCIYSLSGKEEEEDPREGEGTEGAWRRKEEGGKERNASNGLMRSWLEFRTKKGKVGLGESEGGGTDAFGGSREFTILHMEESLNRQEKNTFVPNPAANDLMRCAVLCYHHHPVERRQQWSHADPIAAVAVQSKMAPLERAPAGSGTLRTQRELHDEQHSRAALFAKMNDAVQFTELYALGFVLPLPQSQLQEVQAEMQSCNQSMNSVCRAREMADAFVRDRQREIAGLEDEMRRLKDQSNQRMEMLRRRSKDAYSAAQWLEENKNLFRGKIYPPIMTQLEVPDQQDAKYVEACIPFRDMLAFVAEDPEDMSKFLGLVRDGKGLRVNGVVVPAEPLDSFQPRLSLAQISQLGFRCYIKSMLNAPEGVMRYLCKQCRVHDVPVGTEHSEDRLDEIKSLGIRRFYTRDKLYAVKVSRYDSSRTSTMTTEMSQPSLLTVSVDLGNLRRLEKRKQELSDEIASKSAEVKELAAQERAVSSKLEECRTAKKQLMAEVGRQKQLKVLLDQKRKGLEALERQSLDLDQARARMTKQLQDLCQAKMAEAAGYVRKIQECYQKHRLYVEHRLEMVKVAADKKKLEDALQVALEAYQSLERGVREMRERLVAAKREAQRKLRQAQEAIGCSTDITKIPPNVAKEFLKLPKSAAEITQQIHSEEAKLSCMLPVDSAVEKEYQRRQQDISQLEGDLGSNEGQLIELAEEMTDASNRWLPVVEALLERINQGFRRFFHSLGCAGEVCLYKGEKPQEYDQYGVNIRVKFRDNEPLTELSAAHQSGGERSVATVVYMMALQELTSVPFRCVDEINQGMDSENERKIFEMIMNTALQNSAQYFLLTPKLLPDLPYAENVTMIFITKSENYVEDWKPKLLAGRAVGLAALARG
ncbi:unnamed protein product [Ixodes hexagonus]